MAKWEIPLATAVQLQNHRLYTSEELQILNKPDVVVVYISKADLDAAKIRLLK